MGGKHLTSYVGNKDLEKALVVGESQEMRVFSTLFGVSGVCDIWRLAQDRSRQYGFHHEMEISYKLDII
jgi:hypothetical protein